MELISCKKRYPFHLAAPSFIYPAGYVFNVRRLAPFLDEIELLLFESEPRNLPTKADIRELAAIASATAVTYNVHLPLDIDLADSRSGPQRSAVEKLARATERVAPLFPTTHTMHINYPHDSQKEAMVRAWRRRASLGLDLLIRQTGLPAKAFSIETLDYPPQWLTPFAVHHGVSICMDAGHVIRNGHSLAAAWEALAPHITIVHIHGVSDTNDHLGLDRLDKTHRQTIAQHLEHFTGSLSLEVFSHERLCRSIACFADIMDHTPTFRETHE